MACVQCGYGLDRFKWVGGWGKEDGRVQVSAVQWPSDDHSDHSTNPPHPTIPHLKRNVQSEDVVEMMVLLVTLVCASDKL